MKERNDFINGMMLVSLLLLSACGSGNESAVTTTTGEQNQKATEQYFIQVTWSADLKNSDGSSLTNLAGYNVYLGHNATSIDFKYNFEDPKLTQAEIGPITSGSYYLSISAYNSSGAESTLSEPQLVEVQ